MVEDIDLVNHKICVSYKKYDAELLSNLDATDDAVKSSGRGNNNSTGRSSVGADSNERIKKWVYIESEGKG